MDGRGGRLTLRSAATARISCSRRSWARYRASGNRDFSFIVSHLLSFVLGRLVLDVVVEGAAGVGHEDVVEGRGPTRSFGLRRDQPGRRGLRDYAAVVQHRDRA